MVTRKTAEPETEQEPGGTDDLGSRIEETVRKVVGDLLGSGKLDVADDDEEEKPEKGRPRTAAAVEDDAESKVRAALEKIERERRHEEEHEKLRQAPSESAPTTIRRVTKLMWGD